MKLSGTEHQDGDRRCLECFHGFPTKCQCQGLIHCQFVKENWEGETVLAYACDACGDQYKFPMSKPRRFHRKSTTQKKKRA